MASDNSPLSKSTAAALLRLEKVILDTLDFSQVVRHTVDSMITELEYMRLGYRIIVLILLDKKANVLKRIAISQTPEAAKALANTPVPFQKIEIPLSAKDNLLVKVLQEKKPQSTQYWPDILVPAFTAEEAEKIQSLIGIKTSLVYPVLSKNEAMGVMIFSLIKTEAEVTQEEKDLIAGFTDIVGLAVQNSALYTSLQLTTDSLKQANIRLESLDKLKDEFVSLASHELRTPMTSIKSYLWLLLNKKDQLGEQKEKEYMERVYESTERLIKLVKDMLNVSRIESGRMIINLKPTDLLQLATDSLKDILPSAQNAQVMVTIVSPTSQLPQVTADPEKIKEVFINLIGNSLKFTPKGGKIIISFFQKDDFVVTNITDTGKGVKEEDMPKLFQKFGLIEGNYVALSSTQGTGLGLYLTKSIIELHGGKINVFSEGENKGTTITFSLKITQ